MRILIGLIFFSFVSFTSKNQTQEVVEKQDKIYLWEIPKSFFKLILKDSSKFYLVKDSNTSDCTLSYYCRSYGEYEIKGDSILFHFEKAQGGSRTQEDIELFSNRTLSASFSECEIKFLTLELKNQSCD